MPQQQCTACGSTSPDGTRFCPDCGTPFALTCPSCGAHATRGRFCSDCGTQLAVSAAPAPAAVSAPVSERRTTTVLFGDLVSFTTLSETRDPEEVRELLSQYFSVARTVVGRYGGTIEKFIGDAVMAVWGVPVSHEDDAERAVRAGLDLVAEVAALGASVGAPDLAMRVGIVTGSVAVTLGATNEGMVAGDAVNTAARVQTAAAPGTVWVDQETHGLTAAAVAFSDMGSHELKGKAEAVRLYRADTVVAAVGGAQRVDGLEAPMTGRERELRQVRELFHATQSDGRARLAVVTGVAGIGKSRLGWEFEKYSDGLNDDLFWHRGRCLSYGDGVAFWAFAEMIRSRLKVLDTDDPAEVQEKIRTGVAAVSVTPAEAAWLTPRVAALLSTGDRGVFDRTDLFASWTTLLERVGGEDPVVLVFEDTQHADSGLLDLIEHLLETSRAKLFVLLLTRPELLETRPSLASGRRSTVVDLQPLGDATMATLVEALVDDLPVRARSSLVSRAEGVPLYAVETVRSLIDRDAVIAREGRYVFVDHNHTLVDLDQLVAPTSLQTLIAARLDTLTPTERRLVQDASVLGLSFRQDTLVKLSDLSRGELDAALAALVRKGVIETQSDPRSPELGQYRFLQALVREVAYSTLSRKNRRTRHLAAAAHLGSEDGSEALAGIVAQHLLDALEASAPDDPERPAMLVRARTLLTASAARAAGLGSPSEALRCYLAALTLGPEAVEEAELRLRAARVALQAGHPRQAEELATSGVDRFTALGRPGDAAAGLAVVSRACMNLGRVSDCDVAARRGVEILDASPDDDSSTRIELLLLLSNVARSNGDAASQHAHVIRAGSLAEEAQDPVLLVRTLNGLGIVMTDAGISTAYLALLDRAIQIARDGRLIGELARSLCNMCSETYVNDLDTAAELAAEGVEVCRQVGDNYMTELALTNAGFTWFLRGEWDRLLSAMNEQLEGRDPSTTAGPLWMMLYGVLRARGEALPESLLPASEVPYERLANDIVRAQALAATGDIATAAADAAVVTRSVVGDAGMREDFEMLWSPAVELQLEAGDLETAAELLALAGPLGGGSRAVTRGMVPRFRGLLALARGEDPEDDLREAERALESYGAPYLLARTRLELARWLTGQDRPDEAAPLLDLARPTFVALRATPSVADVDALAGVLIGS